MKCSFSSFLLLSLITTTLFSQVQEVNPPDYIKTITFKGNTNESQLPILKLGEYLRLEFDALNGNEDDYYYKISHYNFDWTPSILVKTEYLSGFDNQRIRNYENSLNAYQIYSHYKLTIPNSQTRSLRVSGNYMISVYNNDDELVFSRKFMIYENKSDVGVALKRTRDINVIQEKQRVAINITPNSMQFNNPMKTVKVLVIQNNNLNTAISNLKPQYTVGSKLIYNYDAPASFWGGNEYLFFENKEIRAANTGVQGIDLKTLYHSYLFTNVERFNKPYTYNPDINGNFVISNIDATDSDIEADYAWVHFSLKPPTNLKGRNIHVYGNFNNYVISEATKMTLDNYSNTYKATILLKQGFYNYKYVLVDKNGIIDEGAISGNFYQTENNYKVLVYYRELGARYDKIIGIGEGSSINISN